MNNIIPRSKELITRGVAVFQDNKITVYSGYATLFIVTAMIPYIILLISIVNLIPGFSEKDVTNILMQLLPNLDSIRSLVELLVADLKDQTGGLLASAAAVTTLWAASKGVMAVQKGLNQLDSVVQDSEIKEEIKETEKDLLLLMLTKGKGYIKGYIRNVIKRLAFTLTYIILIPALLVVDAIADSVAERLIWLLAILLLFVVILQIYAKLPAKNRTLGSQVPGAVLTFVCWIAFTELFSFFVPILYRSSVYGALVSVFLLLLWLRYMVMILFAGAVLNRVLEEEGIR